METMILLEAKQIAESFIRVKAKRPMFKLSKDESFGKLPYLF